MRDRTPLVLMELLVMILIFSAASALCLQAFVWSDRQSAAMAAKDAAVLQGQNMAEEIKACGGNWPEDETENGVWKREADGMVLSAVREDSGLAGLGSAHVEVRESDGTLLFTLPVCWQEETGGRESAGDAS